MKKTAIVTDTSSGITNEEAGRLGIFVLPMPFMINGELFFDGISLTNDNFYEYLAQDADISTSQPAVGDVIDLWEKVLEEYEELVHIPLSSGLSSTCETAVTLSGNYGGRVHVVNNHRVSVTLRQSVMDALALVKKGYDGARIKQILEETAYRSGIYIAVDTLKYLKKGGRITPAAALIGTALNLKPVLQIYGEKLDAYSKCRGIHQAKKIMMQAVHQDLTTKFAESLAAGRVRVQIAHTQNEKEALALREELLVQYPMLDTIVIDPLSLCISCHIGPGSLAIAYTENLAELEA